MYGPNSQGQATPGGAMRITRRDLDWLAAVPMFAGLSQKELRAIIGLGTRVDVSPGNVLTREGARGLEAFLIGDGSARCLVGDTEVGTVGPGAFVGEISLLDGAPRSATVIADTDMQLTVFDRREFVRLVEASPKIATKLLTAMAARVRSLDHRVGHIHG